MIPPLSPESLYFNASSKTSSVVRSTPVLIFKYLDYDKTGNRMRHPCMNTIKRIPGPSTDPKLSVECTCPVTAIMLFLSSKTTDDLVPSDTFKTRGGGFSRPPPEFVTYYIASCIVRAMTSSCCSLVNLMKLTACNQKPESLIVGIFLDELAHQVMYHG